MREQRNYALRTLKDRGMGKRKLEPIIQIEAEALLGKIRENANSPFDIGPFIHLAVSNVMSSVVLGRRYDYEDEEFSYLVKTMTEGIQANLRVSSTCNIPFINWFPFDLSGSKLALRNTSNVRRFMEKSLRDHKSKLERENPTDFVDHYLVRIEEEKGNPDTTFTGKILKPGPLKEISQ